MSGAAPESLARHGATLSGAPEDNPERATLNRYLLSIGPVDSVPVKPLSQLRPVRPTTPHPNALDQKPRNAYAFVASAAHAIRIEAGARIPRRLRFEGVDAIIENGVARDILKAGVATLIPAADPRDEMFALDERQARLVAGLIDREALETRGLL